MVDPSTEKISWRSRRPRSHQIEDISGRRFEDLLPEAWVSRRITPDYGVDREVEIFTSDGVATGLKFAVQLKATDRSSHADRVVLKTALLTYLLDYDVPAIVVRYDVTTGCTRWAWASAIQDCAQLAPNQKTFTHRFENADIWGVDTPAKVERSLRTRRALATFAPSSPMPVRLHIDDALAEARYAIERAMRELIATSYESLVPADADLAPVELNIRIRPGFLSVDFEALGRMTFDLDTSDVPRMVTAILYALAWLFPRKRLGRHGRDIGRAILAGHYAADHPELAARASYAFADDGMAQAELAILNGLHRGDTPYYFAVVASLIRAGVRERSRDAIQLFLAAALEATDGDASRAAAVHYSTANALREKQPVLALFHYNRARHLRPSYLEADYFLAEVAGALFGLRRFAIAAEAYSRAVAIAPTPSSSYAWVTRYFMPEASKTPAIDLNLPWRVTLRRWLKRPS